MTYVPGFTAPLRFPAASMSDGTLRALGILVALLQPGTDAGQPVSLVGIEEPETALHPAATAVLLDALAEASTRRQVIVTSHSPELLDSDQVEPGWVWAVHMVDGRTGILPLSDIGRSLLRDRLYTAGEMLRTGQLAPGSPAVGAGTAGELHAPGGGSRAEPRCQGMAGQAHGEREVHGNARPTGADCRVRPADGAAFTVVRQVLREVTRLLDELRHRQT